MGIRDRFSSAGADGASGAEPAAEAGPTEATAAAAPVTTTPEPSEPVTASKPPKRSRPPKPPKPPKAKPPATEQAPRERAGLELWRTRVAQLLWTAFVLLALVLAVAALLVAIDANEDNGLVDFVLRAADAVDLGVFSRENGVREFTGDNAETKNALFNWGLGAVVYLLLGRLVERLVRPGR